MEVKVANTHQFFAFLSKPRFLIGTSLVRVGFGMLMLYAYMVHYKQRYFLWSGEGIINHTTFQEFSSFLNVYSYSSSLWYFDLMYHMGIFVTILYVLGLKGRWVSVLHFIFAFSLIERNSYIADGGDNLMRILLFYLLFTNSTAYFSMDSEAFWKKYDSIKDTLSYQVHSLLHNFAVVACILQLCVMYLTSGLYQVMGEMWHSGTALYYILQVHEFSNPTLKEFLLQNDLLLVLITYAAIMIKVAFPFLLVNKWTKYIAVVSVVFFHIGIAWGMGLISFSLIMIVADFLLISDEDYQAFRKVSSKAKHWCVVRWRRRARAVGNAEFIQAQRVIVFFDGWCPFCRRSVGLLRKLDWFHLLRFVSFRDPSVLRQYNLDQTKLEKRMHSQKVHDNKFYAGIHAFIQISKRLVPMWFVLPFFMLVDAVGLGQWSYDFVAKRRKIIPDGLCTDTCNVDITNPTQSK